MKLRIRELRLARKLTLAQLGEMIGSDKGTLSKIERGGRSLGSRNIRLISKALGVEPKDLFVSEGAPDVESLAALIYELPLERRNEAVQYIEYLRSLDAEEDEPAV